MDYYEATQAIPLSDYEDETDDEGGEQDGQNKKIVGRLRVLSQKGFPETDFPVYEGKNVIGRQDESDIPIPLKALSKEHACIEVVSGSHIIYDKGSRNKTRRLKMYLAPEVRYELRDGDSLTLGDVKCVYLFGPPPQPKKEEDAGSETGSETGSESMLVDDTEQRVKDDLEKAEVSEPSSDLIEPTQGHSSPIKTRKSRLAPEATLVYASDSEDEDDGKALSQPFASVKETPVPKDGATLLVAESGSESDIFSDRKTATDDEGVQLFLDESDMSMENTRRTTADPTLAYEMDQEEEGSTVPRPVGGGNVAPTQAYTLQPEDETDEAASAETVNKPSTSKTGAVAPTQAYTLEPAEDPEDSGKPSKTAKPAKGKQGAKTTKTVDQTVAYTLDAEGEVDDTAKQQKVSETVAYNMDLGEEETDDEGTGVGKEETKPEPEETQTFSTDSPVLNLGNTLAFDDDDFDDDIDSEILASKGVPRQQTGTFEVEDDGGYDLPTQVFPEDGTVPVSGTEAETQVFEGASEVTDDQSTQVLTDEATKPEVTGQRKTGPSADDDQPTQVFDEADATQPVVTEIPETQVLDGPVSPVGAAATLHLEATQEFSEEDTPTLVVNKSLSPKKKVQWAMEATQMYSQEEEDGDDTEDESQDITVKGRAAGSPTKSALDDTQVLDNAEATQVLDDTCPVITVDVTPGPSNKKTAKTSPRFDLGATQVFSDDAAECEATQIMDDTCPMLELDETPFRKPTKRTNRGSDVLPATQMFNDDANNCDATQMLDDTCPTIELEETPFRKPSKKVFRASDICPATQVFNDDAGNCDATQVLDDTCPTIEVDETPFRTPTKKAPRTSDACPATQVFTSHVKNDDATQMFGETCPTLQVEDLETPKKKQRRSMKEFSPCTATQVYEADSTQILSDDEIDHIEMEPMKATDKACPTLEVEESPFQKRAKKAGKEPDLLAATQVFGDDTAATQMLDDPCPTIELDETPSGKPTKRSTRGSEVCPATQAYNDDVNDCDATQVLDDPLPTLEVEQQETPKKQTRRYVKIPSPAAATQVFGAEETQVLTDNDDEATQELDNPETADIDSPTKTTAKPEDSNKPDGQAQGEDGGSRIDTPLDDQETQAYMDEDPTDEPAPRVETFVHPDEAATQAYGTHDNESDMESSEEVDFGLPIGLPTPAAARKSPKKASKDPPKTDVTGKEEEPDQNGEARLDDDETQEMSEEVAGKPGDEEATQAYMLHDEDEEDEEDDAEAEVAQPATSEADKAKSPDVEDSVLLLEEAPPAVVPQTRRGRGQKAKNTVNTTDTDKTDQKPQTDKQEAEVEVSAVRSKRGARGAQKKDAPEKAEDQPKGKPTRGNRRSKVEQHEVNTEEEVSEGTSQKDKNLEDLSAGTEGPETEQDVSPRKRGRPKKTQVPAEIGTDKEAQETEPPRSRGRPRKSDTHSQETTAEETQETHPRRQRGRPRKSDLEKPSTSAESEKEREAKHEEKGKDNVDDKTKEEVEEKSQKEKPVAHPRRSGQRRKGNEETKEVTLPTIEEDVSSRTTRHKITEAHPKLGEDDSKKSTRGVSGQNKVTGREKEVEHEVVDTVDSQEGSQSSSRKRSSRKPKNEDVEPVTGTSTAKVEEESHTKTSRRVRSDISGKSINLQDAQTSLQTKSKRKSDGQSSVEEMPPLEPPGGRAKRRRGGRGEDSESVASEASSLHDLDTACAATSDDTTHDRLTKKTGVPSGRRSRMADTQPSDSSQDTQDTQTSQSHSPVRSKKGRRAEKEDKNETKTVDSKGKTTETSTKAPGKKKKAEAPKEDESQSSQADSQDSQESSHRGRRGKGKVDYASLASGGRRRSLPQKEADPPQPPQPSLTTETTKRGGGRRKEEHEEECATERGAQKIDNDDTVSVSSECSGKGVLAGRTQGRRGKRSKVDETDSVSGSPPRKQPAARQSRSTGAKETETNESEPVTGPDVSKKPEGRPQRGGRRTEQKPPTVQDVSEQASDKPVSRRGRSHGGAPAKAEKDDDTASVASEEGSSQGAESKAGRGRRRTTQAICTVPPKKETSDGALKRASRRGQGKVKEEEEIDHSQSEKKTVDLEQPKSEASQPRRGRGRPSRVTAIDEEPEEDEKPPSTLRKSQSQGSLGGSQRGRRGKKESEEEEDEFVSLSGGKKAAKREASTDSQTSSSTSSQPAPKKRRGAAEKLPPPTSPSRPQRGQSQQSAPSTPTLRHRTDRPKIMFTGVVDAAGQKIIKELGGELAENMFDCTHLVTDKVRRTVKLLCGVARGMPVVSTRWLDACKDAQAFVDSTPYLVKDTESEKTHRFRLPQSLDRAADNPMLQGLMVHVTKSVKPDPKQMQDIIKCAGGEFLPSLPRGAVSKPANPNLVVVSCEADMSSIRSSLPDDTHIVTAEFLLTGILRQVVDFKAHQLAIGPPDTKRRRR